MLFLNTITYTLLILIGVLSFYLSWLFYSSTDGKLRICLIWFFASLGLLSINLLVRHLLFFNFLFHVGLCCLFTLSLFALLLTSLEIRNKSLEEVLTIKKDEDEE